MAMILVVTSCAGHCPSRLYSMRMLHAFKQCVTSLAGVLYGNQGDTSRVDHAFAWPRLGLNSNI
jgi:hypothetical protein